MAPRAPSSESLVPPQFQALLMLCTTILVSIFIVIRLTMFWPGDRIPILEMYTPQSLNAMGGLPEIIDVGLYIDNFSKFDTINNEFIANCVIWFMLNPGTIPLETVSKFTLQRGIILDKSEPLVTIVNNKLLVKYKIRIDFSTELNYSVFPLDDHYVSIQLVNYFISPNEALFQADEQNLILDKNIHLYDWSLIEKDTAAGYGTIELDPTDNQKNSHFISVVFTLFYSFIGLRSPVSVFLPLILIFFISLFCLSFSDIARLGIAVGTVTALLAYRFVLDGISPKIGYFTLADYLFFSVLGSTFIIFFIVVLDSFGKGPSLLLKKITIVTLHSALLLMILCLVFWGYRW